MGIPVGITSSAIGFKTSAITAAIKKRKHDKIVFIAKSKLNSIEVLISKVLIDSVISHDEFVLINDVLKEYSEIKENKKLKDLINLSKILVYL